jgi:hypothetical protein
VYCIDRTKEHFRVIVVLPLLPAFEGELGKPSGDAIQAITYWNYASICRGGNSLLERLRSEGCGKSCVACGVIEMLKNADNHAM